MTELPLQTREFLSRLTPEDLQNLEEGVKLISAALRLARCSKWIVISIVAGLILYTQAHESVLKIIGWWRG